MQFPIGLRAYYEGKEVISDTTLLDLHDFCDPVVLMWQDGNGDIKHKQIIVYNLPVLTIKTPDGLPIISREVRTDSCEVELIVGGGRNDLGIADIKSRGGSTWYQDKKPYNIKFRKKTELLGMPKSKHWILLANAFYDRTQLHNDVAFQMARMTNYPWVQKGVFVEIILNGEHKGLYYLVEKIGVEKGKINITKIETTDVEGDPLTGGYLLEMYEAPGLVANTFSTDYFNKTGALFSFDLGWIMKEPEDDIPIAQFDYIKNSLNHLESLIWSDDSLKTGKYRDYLDVETAINWWLVEEAALNEEASRTKNMYLYKERGDDHFYLGPPWDFDAWTFGASGNSKFYCTQSTLYYRQLFKDPVFINRVKEKWIEYYPKWKSEIPEYIDRRYEQIANSALRNETLLWKGWYEYYNYPHKSYKECIDDMKKNLLIQLDWMDTQIKNM